jgi:ABC-type amino acid transport substrate-binding protein
MRKSGRYLCLLSVLLCLLLPGTGLGASMSTETLPKLRYTDGEGLWPFIYNDSAGEIQGVVPQSVRQVARQAGYAIEGRSVPSARSVFELVNGRADITTVALYGELTRDIYPATVTLCQEPILTLVTSQVWHIDKSAEAAKPESLELASIGMFNQSPHMEKLAGLAHLNITSFNSTEAMIKALLSQRVDVIFMEWNQAKLLATHLGQADKLVKGLPLTDIKIHITLSEGRFSSTEIEHICDQVTVLKEQGVFDRIMTESLSALENKGL